jgi:hypothetical protein
VSNELRALRKLAHEVGVCLDQDIDVSDNVAAAYEAYEKALDRDKANRAADARREKQLEAFDERARQNGLVLPDQERK